MSHAEALKRFYEGEVLGETIYSALYEAANDPLERRKWATLLQLETETKAWLRPHLVAHGVGVEEHGVDRQRVLDLVVPALGQTWLEQMQVLADGIETQAIPPYQAFAEEAKSRGDSDQESVCRYMVDHEKAQVEFARRELAGDPDALASVTRFLKYPIGT